ncbi:MAG: hypothetical protein HY998_05515 [candidate division NC10 bacterium]|nr:hypothetical protein [candidate division NC10 bacterium]
MWELVRKALLAGIGAVTLSQDRLREMVNELIAQGQLTKEEGNRFIKELLERAEQTKEEWEGKVTELISRALAKMNIPTKDDLEGLKARMAELEKRLLALEEAKGTQIAAQGPRGQGG